MKNLCAKTKKHPEEAYEVWESSDGWKWFVMKKWQADDNKPYARWFCFVISPYCPQGEYGDVYVSEIKKQATRTK